MRDGATRWDDVRRGAPVKRAKRMYGKERRTRRIFVVAMRRAIMLALRLHSIAYWLHGERELM